MLTEDATHCGAWRHLIYDCGCLVGGGGEEKKRGYLFLDPQQVRPGFKGCNSCEADAKRERPRFR